MRLHLLTDWEARGRCADSEEWPDDDGIDHGALNAGPGALRTLADLATVLPDEARVFVMRDWEGCLVAEVVAPERPAGLPDVLALTSDGWVGEGGVNQPRYFRSVAALLTGVRR